MNLGEESIIVWWVPRVITAGGMIMCGWILIFPGCLARTGKYGCDDTVGIRMANILASKEVWKVSHIRASGATQVTGMVFYTSVAWVVIPCFSYYTTLIGLYLAVISTFAIVGYATFVVDQAAAELLHKKAEAEEEQDLQASGCRRQRKPWEAGWDHMFSPRPAALPGVPSTRPASRRVTEQRDTRRGFSVPCDTARLLSGVPEWSGREDANAVHIRVAREMETRTVRDTTGMIVGVALVVRHFPNVVEVHLMVAKCGHHGRGVGRAMIEALERDVRDGGIRLLMVKTLGPLHLDLRYARTRRFYERMDFFPLEETHLWDEDTPCLIMVKPLTGWTPAIRVD